MLLTGYCHGIRFERREGVELNLACRRFCRLDLTGAVPDRSALSKNRHGRFRDCDLLRQVCEVVLTRCINEGFVRGGRLGRTHHCARPKPAATARSGPRIDPWDAMSPERRKSI
ncbi:transposase [Paracoccus sp. Ld10]|uniref:transposase n=1 Tax=Paracoccus sp. Ld10 TaxID=649158 RepID=UPI00386668BC